MVKGSKSTTNKRKRGKSISLSELSEVGKIELGLALDKYEHVFPTSHELLEDEKQSSLARKYIGRLLKSGLKSDTKEKFKDPHLLLYMGKVLDEPSLKLLCNYVSNKGNIYTPPFVCVSVCVLFCVAFSTFLFSTQNKINLCIHT
jgi:hypothetical protein